MERLDHTLRRLHRSDGGKNYGDDCQPSYPLLQLQVLRRCQEIALLNCEGLNARIQLTDLGRLLRDGLVNRGQETLV